jgi:hypothetical protein
VNAERGANMKCSLCRAETNETTHLNLYVNGSEGIEVCLECRLSLTQHAKTIKHVSSKSFLMGIKYEKDKTKNYK